MLQEPSNARNKNHPVQKEPPNAMLVAPGATSTDQNHETGPPRSAGAPVAPAQQGAMGLYRNRRKRREISKPRQHFKSSASKT